MLKPGDTLVLIALFAVILYFAVKNALPVKKREEASEEIRGDVPDLLRREGYEPVLAREKVPLRIEFDGEQYESRVFIDYVARRDGKWYVVVTERERKPLRKSGAGLRDFFLPYYSIFQPDGILYVNKETRTIKMVRFDFQGLEPESKKLPVGWITVAAVCLMTVLVWILE